MSDEEYNEINSILENMTLAQLTDIESRIRWIINNKKYNNCKCLYYGKQKCMGTQGRKQCNCNGDRRYCDFYEHIRNDQMRQDIETIKAGHLPPLNI